MKRKYYLLLSLLSVAQAVIAQYQWTWVTGQQESNVSGNYGLPLISSPTNHPGSRTGAAYWKDSDGKFWLFGGQGIGSDPGTGLLNDLWRFDPSNNLWTWMGGSNTLNSAGSYGIVGLPLPTNIPGARRHAVTWTDKNGNLWLFGGRGFSANGQEGFLNDLWRYSIALKQWTWVNGSTQVDQKGVYGPRSDDNLIVDGDNNGNGGRGNDDDDDDDSGRGNDDDDDDNGSNGNGGGNGGRGNDDDDDDGGSNGNDGGNTGGNDNGGTGNTDNEEEQNNNTGNQDDDEEPFPGGRWMSTSWVDNDGNLWLFGGQGYSSRDDLDDLNDLWKYTISDNKWTWMKGDDRGDANERYGTKGEFDSRNSPTGLRGSTGWTDKSGKFWLFGGANGNDMYSDLWKFDPGINQWAWFSGNKTTDHAPLFPDRGVPNINANPGSRMLATGWTDAEDNLWLFGGNGYGNGGNNQPLNNLWTYSTANNTWTFLKGEISSADPVYGTKGIGNLDNTPGGTAGVASWIDEENNLWFFGGEANSGLLNQTWKLSSACPAASRSRISPASATICEGGSQVLTVNGGIAYEWRKNGVVMDGENKSTLTVTTPGVYSVIVTTDECSAPASNTAEVKVIPKPQGSISPSAAVLCQGATQELTATGGTTYEWLRNGTVIAGQSGAKLIVSEPGTYSAVLIKGECRSEASNTAAITASPVIQGSITPASATICEGSSQTLTASGGTSYQWLKDGVKIQGESGATINVNDPGTYSVIISDGHCTAEAANSAVITLGTQGGARYADVLVNANTPTALSARPDGVTYEWTPNTGLDNPASATPNVSTNTDREYLVRITTSQGCLFVDTVLVKVNAAVPVTTVAVPTAFTPNGNNANDQLRPLGNIASIDFFKVYNRWGNLVFQTNQTGVGWDGRFKGVLQPSDTYTWVLLGKTTDGQVIKLSGKTLLIR
jgi:gliding motility-associated-like protein